MIVIDEVDLIGQKTKDYTALKRLIDISMEINSGLTLVLIGTQVYWTTEDKKIHSRINNIVHFSPYTQA